MPRSGMYLVRDQDGRMRTVMGASCRAAVKIYLRKYPTSRGEELSVKERGVGDWEYYTVQ